MLGCQDQAFTSICFISVLHWEERPVPLRGTFDGADVLSLELVVLLQGTGALLELGVLLLQAVQGLLELLVLCRCVLGREEPGVSGGT